MTNTRQLIVVLAVVAVIAVAALFLLGTETRTVLDTISGGGGLNMTSKP